ncbi:MAG: PfkB family carbohydrate kinase [Candidatus Limnocylindrales bacterium]
MTYAALTTARLGLRTAALVGVDAEAASARELDLLSDAGVDLRLAELPESPVFHNLETSAGRVQTVVRTGVPLEPVALPASWTDAPGWSLAPVAGEIGDGWLASIPGTAIVAVGWQGLLRRLVAGERVERTPPTELGLLRRADLVGVSHHDVDATTKLSELARFLHPGARLLVTQGDRGGLLVTTGPAAADDVLRYLPTRTDGEVDPTGAGDTFLAALLAASIESDLVGSARSWRRTRVAGSATCGRSVWPPSFGSRLRRAH